MRSERRVFSEWMLVATVLALTGWCAADSPAQTTTGKVSGRVTDARTEEALAGVSVAVVGTRLGAVTDANGEYTILGFPPGAIL